MGFGENTASGRELPLRGAVNARDLGGLRTVDGRTVRPRRVLRSDRLDELDDADVTFLLEDCGLRTIIDLRAPGEVHTDGSGPLAERIEFLHNTHVYGADRIRLDLAEVAPDGVLADRYAQYLEHSPANIAAALSLLATAEHLPALVHCAAGKDRTGVVIAVLLGLVGVRAEDIVADYAATAPNVAALRARAARARTGGVPIDRLPDWVFAAEAATMIRFLDHLDTEHGGAVAWATRAGLDPADQRRIADHLLTP